MAWKVGLVLEPDVSVAAMQRLVREMPLWALHSTTLADAASEIREGAGAIWEPEPSFTLFKSSSVEAAEVCADIIPTIFEHHPQLNAVWLPGRYVVASLLSVFHHLQLSKRIETNGGLLFTRDLATLETHVISLESSSWQNIEDFYVSFFAAVGAPNWHGKNLDALHDSICTGGVNALEVPYRLVIDVRGMRPEVRSSLEEISEHFRVFYEREGCPVEMVLVQS